MFSKAKRGKQRKTHKVLISWFKLIKFFLMCLHSVFGSSLKWHNKSHAPKVEPKGNATRTKRFFKFITTVFISCACTIAFSGITLLTSSPVIAAPILTITPITWNVVGLDSNKVNVGPDQFLAGARVCNVGNTAATNVTATFEKTGGSNFISILGGASTLSIPSLPAGLTSHPPGNTGTTPNNCYEFYFNVLITRSDSAYSVLSNPSTRQQFQIAASATDAATVRTPLNREIYVEKLVSQARNAVDSITGPSTVFVGQTVEYTVNAHTAPGGYEQLSVLPVLPVFFQVVSVTATYSTPAGATNNTVYADACGWENDPSSTYYHNNLTCNNPAISDTYSGDKAGDNITTTYKLKVLSTGSGKLTNIIYDFSGSSYHYNADLGTGTNSFAVTAQNPSTGIDLLIKKSHSGNFAVGVEGKYTLSVTNTGLLPTVAPITVTDTLPAGLTYVPTKSGGSDWDCPAVGQNITCTKSTSLAAGANSNITITVKPTATGTVVNSATVATTGDVNATNNTSDDSTTIVDPVKLAINKTVGLASSPNTAITTVSPGTNITYTITATNTSGFGITNATIEDVIESAIVLTSVSDCSTSGGNGQNTDSCTITRTDNNISATVSLRDKAKATFTVTGTVSSTATGTIPNTALITPPAGLLDSDTSDNTKTVTVNVQAPDLEITKTASGPFLLNQNSSFVLTVRNVGLASTTGTTTVTDNLPPGLTYVSYTASITDWSCSASGQTVTCTNTRAIAAQASSTITLTVTRTSAEAISNTASVSNTSDNNTGNNSSTASVAAIPRLRIVKRITAINTTSFTNVVDPATTSDPNDDNTLNWPVSYLKGAIDGGLIKPKDSVEYTIYFLSDGGSDAAAVTICDLVPTNTTFAASAFGTDQGISLTLDSTTTALTNAADGDKGQFYNPRTQPPAACKAPPLFTSPAVADSNGSGAIVVDVVKNPTTLSKATAPGTPNSYGFVRFRVNVN